jgi:tetratricopeptide (TPR) repeat protein
VIDLCDDILDRDDQDVHALFFKGGALGFQGRLRFHRDDWFAAANAGRKALPIVQDAAAIDPKNYDVHLGTGIYNYYAEVIPQKYPIAKPLLLFIPAGDKQKGIAELHSAAEKGRYASVEAKYFLMQLYYQNEKEYHKARTLAEELHQRFPNNMLFHKYLGRCYVILGQWQMADSLFGEIVQRAREGMRGYTEAVEREAVYYLGLGAMAVKDHRTALEHLLRCEELSRVLDLKKESGFAVMTQLKIGMLHDLSVNREEAMQRYRNVLRMREYLDSHDQARKYLKSPYAL